jgi:hypothetical protein
VAAYRPGSEADTQEILVAVLIGAGFVLGIVLGRWWALLASLGLGAWIGVTSELDVHWWLGAVYAAYSGLGIAAGVLFRRYVAKPS